MQIYAQPVSHFFTALGALLHDPRFFIILFAGAWGIASRRLRKLRQRAKESGRARSVRGWLAVPATIDVVSVVERKESENKAFYLATLTYFYRRPELQMGEFEREFPLKATAQQWVKQFKGRQVTVQVNPDNPADSVLLASSLAGLETHQIPASDAPKLLDTPPELSHSIRFLSGIGEMVSLAGLGMSAVLLAVSLATHGTQHARIFYWIGGALLAVAGISLLLVQHQLKRIDAGASFLQSYKQWCPAWMRWTLNLSTSGGGVLTFLARFHDNLPAFVETSMKALAPHAIFLIGCWAFLGCVAFHTAILRSQEQVGVPQAADSIP